MIVVLPPGGNGTIRRIGRVGYVSCASAVTDQPHSNNAAHWSHMVETNALRIVLFSPDL
jgi:hypothetical protein